MTTTKRGGAAGWGNSFWGNSRGLSRLPPRIYVCTKARHCSAARQHTVWPHVATFKFMASLAETLVKQQAGGTGSNGPRASSYRLHLPADQRPNGAPGGQMGGGSPVKPEDPDIYISSVAATWGRVDLINDWLPHNKHEPEKIARLVLSRAAMYGQLGVLRRTEALLYGELGQLAGCTASITSTTCVCV